MFTSVRSQRWARVGLGLILLGAVVAVAGRSWHIGGQSGEPAPEVPGVELAAQDVASPAFTASQLCLGTPAIYKNLTVFPVLSRAAKNEDLFITLDEGLKSGEVQIFELGALQHGAGADPFAAPAPLPAGNNNPAQPANLPAADPFAATPMQAPRDNRPAADDLFGEPAPSPANATNAADDNPFGEAPAANPFGQAPIATMVANNVNRLAVLNRADRPLYLMPGEIIVGGQQDRTLAHETIIPPSKEPQQIEVYCVEHGRWSGRAPRDTAHVVNGLELFDVSVDEVQVLSEKAVKGQFVCSAGNLNKPSREAVQSGKGQNAVWDEVSAQNLLMCAKTSSDAFTANYAQKDVTEKLQPYVDHLQQTVAAQARVVGVVVAVNGRPEMADVFGSTPLFRKLWPKLLKSYALDAAGSAKDQPTANCTAAKAQAFLNAASQAQVVSSDSRGQGLVVTRQATDELDSYSAAPAATFSESAAGRSSTARRTFTAGFGGSIHSAAFAK